MQKHLKINTVKEIIYKTEKDSQTQKTKLMITKGRKSRGEIN